MTTSRTCEHTWDDVAAATACGLCGAVRLEADLARVSRPTCVCNSPSRQTACGRCGLAIPSERDDLARVTKERDEARRDCAAAVEAYGVAVQRKGAAEAERDDLLSPAEASSAARRHVTAQDWIHWCRGALDALDAADPKINPK